MLNVQLPADRDLAETKREMNQGSKIREVGRRGGGSPLSEVTSYSRKNSRYAIAVVTWNEGERIRAQLERMAELAGRADIIVVDGESDDGSITGGHLRSCGVRSLILVREPGLGSAIRAAISFALAEGYGGLITVDGNGKDGVEAIPLFIDALDRGVGLAQGSRFVEGGVHRNTPPGRLAGISLVVRPLVRLASGFRYTDPTNGFRGMSREFLEDGRAQLLRALFRRFNLQLYIVTRAARLGYVVEEIPVRRSYPDDHSVPTKIIRLRTKLLFLWELFMTVAGRYNPRGGGERSVE